MEQIVTQQMVNELEEFLKRNCFFYNNSPLKNEPTPNIIKAAEEGNKEAKELVEKAKKTIKEFNKKCKIFELFINKTVNIDENKLSCKWDFIIHENVKIDILIEYGFAIYTLVNALMLSNDLECLKYTDKLISDFSKNIKNTNIKYKKINDIPQHLNWIKRFMYVALGSCWKAQGKTYEYKHIEAKKMSNYYVLLSQPQSCYIPTTAYSFRKCTTYLYQALINDKINLTSPYQYNDPIDCPLKEKTDEITKTTFKDCVKIACFTSNTKLPYKKDEETELIKNEKKQTISGNEFLNLLMWPHYADSHKGICIRYNFSSFDLSQINNDNSQKVAFFKDIEYNNDKLKKEFSHKKPEEGAPINDAFFLKSEVWKYENELRLLYYDVNGKGDYTTIDAPNCIEAIYFGIKCSDEDKKTIHKILKDKTVKINDEKGNLKSENIKFYQMEIDKDNFGQLKAVDYNPD
jgi:hypothetical protein